MKPSLILLASLAAGALPAFTAMAQAQNTAYESRENETPAQRAARIARDEAHSTAHANETPAQRAARLAGDRRRSMAEHAEDETPAQRAARLERDREHSMERHDHDPR